LRRERCARVRLPVATRGRSCGEKRRGAAARHPRPTFAILGDVHFEANFRLLDIDWAASVLTGSLRGPDGAVLRSRQLPVGAKASIGSPPR
jgi:hypothetical protein